MNVNLLANNPGWWWYLVLSGAALGLVLMIWIIVKNIKVRSPYPCWCCLSQAGLIIAQKWRKKEKGRKTDIEMGDIAPDKDKDKLH